MGLYPGVGLHPVIELRQASLGTTLVVGMFVASQFLQHGFPAHATKLLAAAWLLMLVAAPSCRSIARRLCARQEWWGQRALILGSGRAGMNMYRYLQSRPWLGLHPVGVVDDCRASGAASDEPYFLGSFSATPSIARRRGLSWAVVAMPERSRSDILRVVELFTRDFPHVLVVPDMEGLPSLLTCAHECGGMSVLRVDERLLLPMPQCVKRLMDLTLIVVAAPLLLPCIAVVAAMVKVSSPGPVFYRHQRIGRGGRRFFAWKFRSMVKNADQVLASYLADNPNYRAEWERDHKLRKDPRVTRVGEFLRKTSLDELPQLWNVVRNEMSLVGPRPIVEAEISKYSERFQFYTKVAPGITGLWQISGRNDTTYGERVDLDAYYVRNWSAWLDLIILACTIRVVLFRDGAY
jgi:Undecaprenyl-phosphate galactose phosphotransferase WbaP